MDQIARQPLHVLIYGPPAAGKLTVASAFAQRFGFRLLDNHVTMDPALRLFTFGDPELGALTQRLRVEMYATAARHHIDVVSTLVYAHPQDRDNADEYRRVIEAEGGALLRVQLVSDWERLLERVSAELRRASRKITDPALLRRMLASNDLYTPINPTDLCVNNNGHSPAAVADLIARHHGITTRDDRTT